MTDCISRKAALACLRTIRDATKSLMELEQEVEEVMSKAKVYEKDAVIKCGSCAHYWDDACCLHQMDVPPDYYCADAAEEA